MLSRILDFPNIFLSCLFLINSPTTLIYLRPILSLIWWLQTFPAFGFRYISSEGMSLTWFCINRRGFFQNRSYCKSHEEERFFFSNALHLNICSIFSPLCLFISSNVLNSSMKDRKLLLFCREHFSQLSQYLSPASFRKWVQCSSTASSEGYRGLETGMGKISFVALCDSSGRG